MCHFKNQFANFYIKKMSLLQKLLFTALLITIATTENIQIGESTVILTKNLFANLKEDPQLKDEYLTDSLKMFIDKVVANYLDLMKFALGISKHMVTRRSLPIDDINSITQDYTGVYMLRGFKELFNIKTRYPKDIALFYHNYDNNYKQWYAAVLEGEKWKIANKMVIYKLMYSEFKKVQELAVEHGSKLSVHLVEETTFIAVAEYNPPRQNLYEETGVFEFTKSEELRKIQTLNIQYASDVKIWKDDHNLFLAFAPHMTNTSNHVSYETVMPVYKWLGKHFDVIQEIQTYGAKSIESFIIGKSHFLAVANYQNNNGKTNIYSEIFKYDFNTDKFKMHQKILTNAAINVKHFDFSANNIQEHFLVFANLFEEGTGTYQNYETDSIIYKYIEGYFMPFQSFKLNGATGWLPIMGPKNEFLLLVACKFEGIKVFQYNGWRFVESSVQYTNGAFSKGVNSMRSYQFQNKTILVIANENDHGDMSNIFEVEFTYHNDLDKFQENMLDWCKHSTKTAQDIKLQIRKHEDGNNPILQLEKSPSAGVVSEQLKAFEIEEDVEEEDLSQIKSIIESQSEQLDVLEKQVASSVFQNGTNVIEGSISIKKLTLNNRDSFFNALNATFINSVNALDVIKDVININDGFTITNKFQAEDVQIENNILPTFLNGISIATLIHKKLDNNLGHLIVNGSVTFKKQFDVQGKVNGIHFNRKNILLNKGDQFLTNLQANSIKIENLEVNKNLDSLTFLSAKKVFVNGYVNKVDIQTLNKFALRKTGPQTITSRYLFDTVYVDNLFATRISGKSLPDDLILTKGGVYDFENAFVFTQDVTADNVLVTERLNGILSTNGKLDVLLVDAPHVQHIQGTKTFENLDLLNPINLQGKIRSSQLEKMNPISTIDDDVVLNGNFIIAGNISIEKFIRAKDIQVESKVFGIQRLWNKGLKLVEQQIPMHLHFQQQIHVDELFADEINGQNVNSFVIMGLQQPQIITGWKKIVGDVNILGPTTVNNMNGIPLKGFESNILKTTGNQTLMGKHHFETIIANRVYNIKTQFGNQIWDNVVTTNSNQKINGTTIITSNSIQVNSIQTKTLNSLHINGYDFNNIINDTVFEGQQKHLLGVNKFLELTVSNLVVQAQDMDQIPQIIENAKATFQIDESINLPNNIHIENIFFNKRFNGIPSENFGHQWIAGETEQIIESDQNFDKLVIYGKLFIESGFINDVNVIDIRDNSIKTDEQFHFETVTFVRGLKSLQGISLEGKFENLYLNDIIQSDTRAEQIITGETLFNNDIVIYGDVHFNGLVSGINITNLCNFAFATDNTYGPYNLYVKGNVYFAKGPVVQHINALPIKSIIDHAWFKNKEVYLTGKSHFDHAIFQQEVIVEGLVDEVKPQEIVNNYLSKTKNQNITTPLHIDNKVVFANGVSASEAKVDGTICGLNLEKFIRTAVLDEYEQVFESPVLLDSCQVLDLQGEYLVNNLNLETDVMRYDTPNIVTGKKIIQNLQVNSMTLDHNVKIQNVDLLWWIQNAVLKKGTFSISGEIVFQNTTTFTSQVSTQGFVNGQIFNQDTIMLKSTPQIIHGSTILGGDINFESVKLKGLLNGFDSTQFLYNQAYKNQNVSIKTPVHFSAEIAAPNINFDKLYQGVNVSRLFHNLTRFATIENYQEHYEKLLNNSIWVKNSLMAQAYILDHYEVKQTYKSVHNIIPVVFQNDSDVYLACIIKRSYQSYVIMFQAWNKEKEQYYHANGIKDVELTIEVNYIKNIVFQGIERWYIESRSNNSNIFESKIYDVTKEGLVQVLPPIFHNCTKSVAFLTLPSKNASCIFLLFSENPALYCEQQINQDKFVALHQTFVANNTIAVATHNIRSSVYIFIAHTENFFGESTIDIWKYDARMNMFTIDQQLYTTNVNSISAINCRESHYLIISSGRLENTKHEGLLNIYRYFNATDIFEMDQIININAPVHVQFTELPRHDLILYVVTENPSGPLVIFAYEGIAGFRQKFVASTIPKTVAVASFNRHDNRHFVLAQNTNEATIIEGVFKGYKSL